MQTAVYLRTSTKDQDGQAQHTALEKALQQRGESEVTWYTDIGHSGSKAQRPELDRLRLAVRLGEVSKIYVYALDRLGRSLTNLIDLFNYFDSCNVPVISLREGLDLSTASGRLQMHMLSALSEFEKELIKERTRAGLANARRKGIKLGRRTSDKRVLHADKVVQMRAAGMSISAIAAAVGIPTTTVFRMVGKAK